MGSSNTGSSMLHRPTAKKLVWFLPQQHERSILGDREFAQVMSHHLGPDFNLVELLAAVDGHNAANHLGDHDHISKMRLYRRWFLVRRGCGLCIAKFLDEAMDA